MSESEEPESPEVLQGRLGWQDGDVSEAKPDELEPHPKNAEIYGDTDGISDTEDTFIESVREKGVLEPLVVTDGKKIISGHRRWLAAQAAGVDSVPIRKSSFDSDLAEREALIEFNRQREKTPGQIVNEFEEMLAIERERACDRKTEATGHREKFHEAESGRAKNKAAEKVNADVSGRTLEKGKKVKDKAESDDEPDEVQKVAEREWQKLQQGKTSFHTASKNVEQVEAKKKVENQRKTADEKRGGPVVQETSATDLIEQTPTADLLLTDPPYTTDVDDIDAFARSWVPPALDTIGDGGLAFIFVGAYADELQTYLTVLDECGVRERAQVLVWTYKNTLGQTPNHEYKRNWQAVLFIQSDPPREIDSPLTSEQWGVQDINAPDGRHDGRHHKWQKPAEIIERFIRHTTDEGDVVLDPFVGTGTTALVANELNREVVAGDNDTEMLDTAVERGCIADE
ncbi:adenine methyltransferase [environmental Halophage eHP-12]|nr:adenine methyltransferase [environmental Halophage eHP-12]